MGANLRIQQNRAEKTTAPTVMDCVQCLHWLRASRSRGNPGGLGPEPLEPDDSQGRPHGRAEPCNHPPGTTCSPDIRDSSAGSGRPWTFPEPADEWVLLKADVTRLIDASRSFSRNGVTRLPSLVTNGGLTL